MKLSVAISVYNTSPDYLEACLRSVRESTLNTSDYEIILVDDGSDRDYDEVARRWDAHLFKTENRGVLLSRLYAISRCSGDYIAFVDSDDTVSYRYHAPMLQTALREGLDIVMNDWAFHTERCRRVCRADSTISTDFAQEGDGVLRRFFRSFGTEQSYYVLWNKLYRREILQTAAEEILAQPFSLIPRKQICYGEDVLINFYAYRAARSLRNIHTGYYFYRIHPNQSVVVTSEDRLRRQILSMGEAFRQMEAGCRGREDGDRILADLAAWRALLSRTHYSYAKKQGATGLYDLIRSQYRVTHLRTSTLADGRAYAKSYILPENYEEIEHALYTLWKSDAEAVAYDPGDTYVQREVDAIRAERGIALPCRKEAPLRIPRSRVSWKNRLLHIAWVYRLGMLLFPKGSRLRAFLKRHV